MKKHLIIFLLLYIQLSFCQSTPDGLERPRFYDVQHILINLQFDEKNRTVIGECTTTLQPLNDNFSNFELDAIEMNIKSVVLLSGKSLKFETASNKLKIFLDKPYLKKDKIIFTVSYDCSPKQGLYFIQPDSTNPSRPWQIWTQGQGRGNDHWFPMYNYYNDKTTTETIVTVKDNYTVLSNGKLIAIKENKLEHTKTFHWKETKPHATYLVMLAIGEYSIIKDNYKNIPVNYYVYKSQEKDAKRCFKLTPDMIKFFSQKTGVEYPFEQYAQVCLYDFMYGGMENTSATTLNDMRAVYDKRTEIDYQNTSLVAHELAHQWYGDCVTQKEGISHWLHEGFATYFDALYHEYKYGHEEFMRIMDRNMQSYKEDEARIGRLPMASKTTPFVYVKGASLLNMLRFIVGDKDFDKIIKTYTKRFAYKNVITADFQKVITEVTGKDLSWFFDEWLFKAGYPGLIVKTNYIESHRLLELDVKQNHKTDSLVPVFRMPVDVEVTTKDGVKIHRIEISKADETFHIKVDSKPLNVIFDKGNWIVKDLIFEKPKEDLLFQLKNAAEAIDRKNAVKSLKKYIYDLEVFNALKYSAANDKSWVVRIETIDSALIYSRREGFDILINGLKDPKSEIRLESLSNLKNTNDDRVIPILRNIIKSDSSYLVVSNTLIMLAALDPKNSFEIIAPFTKESSYRDILKIGAINALGILKDKRALPLLFLLGEKNESQKVRDYAISLLPSYGRNTESIEFLKTLFNDPDYKIKLTVFRILGMIGDKDLLPVLVQRNKSESNAQIKEEINKSIREIRSRER